MQKPAFAKTLAYIALAASLPLAACSGSEPEQTDPVVPAAQDEPMILSAKPADASFYTRASALRDNSRANSPLQDLYNDFGVFAWKEDAAGGTQTVLSRPDASAFLTQWTGTAWRYDLTDGSVIQYIHYWDPAARNYTFVGYAPYSVGSTDLEDVFAISASTAGISIQGVRGNAQHSASSPDWLEARYSRVNSQPLADFDLLAADPTENIAASGAVLHSVVPLVFHHILSLVEVRIYTSETDPESIISANLSLADGAQVSTLANYSCGAWASLSSPTATLMAHTGSLSVPGPERDDAVALASLLEIPQDLSAASIAVELQSAGGATLAGTFPVTHAWQGGMKYIYYLRINGSDEIILMDVQADPYLAKDDTDIVGGTVINW